MEDMELLSDENAEIAYKQIFDVPKGQYRLIGWDMDTTDGKELCNEICHIAAYYPDSQFSQYILPSNDLSLLVERRNKIRVISVSHYRMLADLHTNTLLETKSELATLLAFVSWLEKNKGESNDGIILIYHEVKKLVPLILLEILKCYRLYDRFAAVVKGFCNTYIIAKLKCTKTLSFFSIQVLSRILLNEDDADLARSAAVRAKTHYAILERIRQTQDDFQGLDGSGGTAVTSVELSEFARQYSQSTFVEEKAFRDRKESMECQHSLRPIFKDVMNFGWVSRMNAGRLRSKLVECNINFDALQNAWDNGGKKAIKQILKTVPISRTKDFSNLLKILVCYFDPNRKPVYPNFCNRRKAITVLTETGDQLIVDDTLESSEVSSDGN